jgi:LPS-assembly lipoprotein
LPTSENLGIDAQYNLIDVATGKSVMTGSTFSRVSYDMPGSYQRFSRTRAVRDAEDRAANEIADNITTRLASFFTAGT